MSRHESLARLRHMLDHAREAIAMLEQIVQSDGSTAKAKKPKRAKK